jgi:hypothetical protein
MNATTTNGTQRRTLAQQIDRLDDILDGLDEALAGAVADAVRQATGTAVKEAVRLALVEVLTNADVLALISAAAHTHAPALLPPRPPTPLPLTAGRRCASVWESWAGGPARGSGPRAPPAPAPPPPGCSTCPGWAPGCARCGDSAGSCCWRWASAPAPGWPPTWPARRRPAQRPGHLRHHAGRPGRHLTEAADRRGRARRRGLTIPRDEP